MKKIIFVPMLLLTFTVWVLAQGKDKTPEAVKAAFAKAYPKATKAKFEKEGMNYEAEFMLNGKEMSAVYDAHGALIETEEPVMASQLPPAIMTYYNAHYKGVAIKETTKIVNSKGVVSYEIGTKQKDIIFDASGKFLKEEKKDKEEDKD